MKKSQASEKGNERAKRGIFAGFGSFGRFAEKAEKATNETKAENSKSVETSFRMIGARVTSLLLILSILTASAPAAPSIFISSVNDFGEEVRYAWMTSSLAASLTEINIWDNPILGFFVKGVKKATPVKLEVSPGQAVLREGEEIVFTAKGMDTGGNAVQGIGFKWVAVNMGAGTKAAPIRMENGVFRAESPGMFEITAEGAGLKGKAIIRVIKDARMLAAQEAEEIQKNKGKGRAGRQIRNDVQKEMAGIKTFARNNSSRMRKSDAKELTKMEREYLKASPVREEVNPGKKIPPLRKAGALDNNNKPIGQPSGQPLGQPGGQPNGGEKRGGPSAPAEVGESVGIDGVWGSVYPISGTTLTGCVRGTYSGTSGGLGYNLNFEGIPREGGPSAREELESGGSLAASLGSYAINVEFYVDGSPYGGGSFGGDAYVFGGEGCRFSFNIPNTYWDNQRHTITAVAYDPAYGDYVELNGAPQDFQIDSNGSTSTTTTGGTTSTTTGTTGGLPVWNDTNFPTADDPGVQTGTPANDGTAGAGSGNFGFAAPIVSLAGRGQDINLSLNYNSLVWHNDGSYISYDIDKGSPAPGWNIGFGKMMDMGTSGGVMVEDVDGTRHSYQGTTQSWSGGYSTYYGKTTDGSFIDYTVTRSPAGLSGGTAKLANGTEITYGAPFDAVLYPTTIKDRHGNYIAISYQNNQGPKITTVTDNLGRVITFNYDADNRLVSVSGPGFNGSSTVLVRIHYKQQTLSYGFSGLTPQVTNNAPYQIDSIYYPATNTGYWFGDGDSYSSYGMIAKVSGMRGMSWSGAGNNDQGTIGKGVMTKQMVYNYPMTANSSLAGAPEYTTMTEDWAGRDAETPAAVVKYAVVNNPAAGQPRTTTVTTPDGNRSIQYSRNDPNAADDGLLYKVETYAPAGTTPFGKTETEWELGDYNSMRVKAIYGTDELGQTTKQSFEYGAVFNQVNAVNQYGYGTNGSFPLERRSVSSYENGANYVGTASLINGQNYLTSGRHIFSLVKTQELFDAGNNRLTRSEINYDQSPLLNTPNVSMYDQMYNPYNPSTTEGNCINWEYNKIQPVYWQYYEAYDYTFDEPVCTQYEQIPNFDSATAARGNATETKTYSDAATLSGAISYVSTFDITGNTRTTTTNCCQQMSFEYTAATQYSQPEGHAKGSSDPASPYRMTETAVYDFNTGLMKTATDFNGRTTTTIYDAANRPIQTILPTGGKSVTEYDDLNMKMTQTALESNGNIVSQGRSFADGRGQAVVSESLAGSGWNAAQVKYDTLGRKTRSSMPYVSGTNPSRWTTYTYDQFSRVTTVTAPDGSQNSTFYNESSRPGSATGAPGQTVRSRDAWGRERWARSDAFGRLAEVAEPDPNGTGSVLEAGSLITTYSYNPKDELIRVNQGEQLRAFKYDSLGRLTRQKLAEQNASLSDAGGFVGGNNGLWSDAFVYDNRSNLVQRTDPRGVKTNFDYTLNGGPDPLNRLLRISYDKTGADQTYPIADASPVELSYIATGDKTRVETVTTAAAVEKNTYDIEGRIQEYTAVYAGLASYPLTTTYFYDTANRLSSVMYPAQYGMPNNPRKTVAPSYDNSSRLADLKVDNQIQMSEIQYNPMSQVTQLKTAAGTGNADIEQYSYDASTGLLTNQKVVKQNSNQTLLDLSYNYNKGNSKGSLNGKTGQLTNIINNLDPNKNRVFEFDTLGRLTTAKGGIAAGGSGVANWTQNYAFDRYGNRTSVSASGVTANNQAVPTDGLPNMSYDNQSNRINNNNYAYDLAGNVVRGQKPDGTFQRFEYDAAGRLTIVRDDAGNPIESYTYGASRQRLLTASGSLLTFYAWGGTNVLCEYTEATGNSASFRFSKSYVYAGSRLLSTQTWNGATEVTEFHHPDRLGTKVVTNNATNTFYEQSTLPFGTSLDGEFIGTPTTNQRFTSYERSAATGLDYAQNRSYSSGAGRFTSVDPIGMSSGNLGNPQSNNLFAYAQNNPVDFTDPSGLDPDIGVSTVNVSGGGYDVLDPWGLGTMIFGSLSARPMLDIPAFYGGQLGVVEVTAEAESPRAPTYEQIRQTTTDCINSMWEIKGNRTFIVSSFNFAISGVSNGWTTVIHQQNDGRGNVNNNLITISVDALSKSGSELDSDGERGGYMMGWTGWSTGKSYIANDLYSHKSHGLNTGLDRLIDQTQATQIHELGVALSSYFGQKDPPRKYWVNAKNPDRDSGMTLEDCVHKRLTGKR